MMRRLGVALVLLALFGCKGSPTEPRATTIAEGRWSGEGACLMVAGRDTYPNVARLTVGCGQGEFPRPMTLRADGTFDAEGTYGIVAGPARNEPLPPAHFSGKVIATTLTLTVTPSSASLPAATYHLHMDAGSTCPSPCV